MPTPETKNGIMSESTLSYIVIQIPEGLIKYIIYIWLLASVHLKGFGLTPQAQNYSKVLLYWSIDLIFIDQSYDKVLITKLYWLYIIFRGSDSDPVFEKKVGSGF